MSTDNRTLVPVTKDEMTVLTWHAEWTPEVHRADWQRRRAWPPGFREMADLSCPGFSDRNNTVANAEAKMKAGPILRGDTPHKRKGARACLSKLIAYRLLEGSAEACRLTARGRAALKLRGLAAPDSFQSHCPDVFDDHSLLPVNGVNAHLDREVAAKLSPASHDYNADLPDTPALWEALLVEYQESHHMSILGLASGTAGLRTVSVNGMYLAGSMRNHHKVVSLDIADSATGATVCECFLSMEGLAELMVSNTDVPVTLSHFRGGDGMAYSRLAPPPLSVSRRMAARLAKGDQNMADRVAEATKMVSEAKMGVKAQKEILDLLGLLARDVPTHGAFATEQAMEEMSSVAESLLAVMAERVPSAAGAPLLSAGGPVTPALLLLGSSVE